jgi:hypothetical protein
MSMAINGKQSRFVKGVGVDTAVILNAFDGCWVLSFFFSSV